MRNKKLRARWAGAVATTVVSLAAMLVLQGGVASALSIPPYPTAGVYPNWLTAGTGTPGTQSASNIVRSEGSDTTFFMMQQLGDLYTQAGLYGCPLLASSNYSDCDNSTGTAPNYQDQATTDTVDNFDRTEVLEGVNNLGSGNGQQQLCGTQQHPDNVDFARSSKPAGTIAGCTMQELGYAKDFIPNLDFPDVDPQAVGSPSYYVGKTFNGVAFPSGGIGPVADGWLPGDPYNCGAPLGHAACSGVPFFDVDNTGGASSIAYRLWCATDSTRITDWGQLTNLNANGPGNGGVAKTIGNGAPIGVPVRIIGINTGSGTVATFSSFANSGVSGGNCSTSSVMDGNAASGPNPLVNNGLSGNLEIAVENNASQVGDFASADFPNDPADQAVELATALYPESGGVNLANPNAGTTCLEPGTGTVPSGVPLCHAGKPSNLNNVAPSQINTIHNTYPTARTLFNIFLPSNIRASTAGLLNWLCDDNNAFVKKTDLTTGVSFDQEISNIIGSFDYLRLYDNNSEASVLTPADGVTAPNATCDANLAMNGDGTDGVMTMANSGPVPSSQAFAVNQPVFGTGIPSGTKIVSVSSGTPGTITLSNTIPSGTTTVYFPGMAPVLSVTSPNS
jgi:hypothetical protein